MVTINTQKSKTNEPHRFRLSLVFFFIYIYISLVDKLNLKDLNKNMALANLSIFYAWKNIKSAYKKNKFKISAPTWNDEFDLPDGSYSVAYIQDDFKFIIKKQETLTENSPVQIYPNKIKNRIAFKVKTGYKLGLLSSETMKLLSSTKKDNNQDKDREDVPRLGSAEVVLVHCNLVNNNYQQASKVLFTLVPNNNVDSN